MSDASMNNEFSSSSERSARRSRRRRRARIGWIVGIGVVLGAVAWLALSSGQAPSVQPAAAAADAGGCANGRSIFVAPAGVPGDDGSREHPIDLATALSSAGPAKPCDTVWLRGGTYRGSFVCSIEGRDGAPILIRQMPGERVTIDSAPSATPALHVKGSWLWFWGLEMTNSDPQRMSQQTGGWPSDLKRSSGVTTAGSHLKFINFIVHDMTRGFEIGSASIDTEVYGSLVYFNGWEAPKQTANGHGIDTHNRVGPRQIIDNILFGQFSHGIIGYASDQDPVHNLTIEGNIIFKNGILGQGRDLLIGGGSIAQRPVLKDNVSYGAAQMAVGSGAGCSDATVENNYFAGSFVMSSCDGVVKGNTIFGSPGAWAAHPDNTIVTGAPSGTVVRVRPNQYERGRAHIAVFNWDKRADVELDLSTVGLTAGMPYEIRDAQNYFGSPVYKGVYGNPKLLVSMTHMIIARPVGLAASLPTHTAPEFAAFVVVPDASQTTMGDKRP